MTAGFAVTASDRLDHLVADLAARLAVSPLPPHRDECIVVQSLSLRRWLQQRLAEAWGCAAGLDLPFPAGLIAELERSLDLVDDDDPWARDRLRWRIAALAEHATGELAPLAAYLAAGHPAARPAKRLQLADRLADLLDAYQMYRPELLAAWEAGRSWEGLGDDVALAQHEVWQAALWRRLRADLAVPPRSHRLDALVERLRRDGPPPRWHARVSVLATGVLPPRVVAVLEALGGHVPVGLWLVSPLPQPWGDAVSPREAATRGLAAAGHPLVASLGRQARDWFRAVADRPAWAAGWSWLATARPPATTVLARLHAELGEAAVGPKPTLAADDRSLAFDCCHGPRREVEVARDRILVACAELPRLRPHEILILAPDLDLYAPLCAAVFGAVDPAIRLPLTVADRRVGEDDPVSEALMAVIALARGRCGLAEVLDLLERPAVRAAAGLEPEQVAQAHSALLAAGLRWGRDGGHRAELLGLPEADDPGTLAAALDRIALGWAMGPDAVWGRPASGVDGAPDHALLAALLPWLQRLLSEVAALARPRPLPAWRVALDRLLSGLLAAPGLDLAEARAAVLQLEADAGGLPVDFSVSLAEVASALETALGDEARASDFVSGSITLAGLKPMRMIPARVVVLLGMADGTWPRRSPALPFDLLAARPCPGDRQVREDDRQLFLEAVLAAGERLVVTWPGRAAQGDPRHERPPSACLAELFDAVDATCAWDPADETTRPSRRLTAAHPLQPFAASYLGGTEAPPPTWDAAALDLARRLLVPPAARPAVPRFASPLPPPPRRAIDLDELVRLWADPAAAWCRERLGVSPRREQDAVTEDEPFALSGLERYHLIDALVHHPDRAAALARASADGLLPLGHPGRVLGARLIREAEALAAALAPAGGAPLALDLPTLAGVLDPPPRDGVLRRVHAGTAVSDGARQALAIRLLAWNAWQELRGDPPGGGELIARGERLQLVGVGAGAAQRLAELLDLAREALAAPLPFFPRTAWVAHCRRDQPIGDLLAGLSRNAPWLPDPHRGQDGECETPAVALAWRGGEPLTAEAVRLMQRVWELLPNPADAARAAKPRKGWR